MQLLIWLIQRAQEHKDATNHVGLLERWDLVEVRRQGFESLEVSHR